MLSALQVAKSIIKDARDTFESTVGDLDSSYLHADPGGKALPISAVYAHLILSEDLTIHSMLQQIPALYESSWKDKSGVSELMPPMDSNWPVAHAQWAKSVQVDLDQLKKYSLAVYADTDKYLESLTDADLEREIDLGSWGKKTILSMLTSFIAGHTYCLTGEISAVKGVNGVTGYPF